MDKFIKFQTYLSSFEGKHLVPWKMNYIIKTIDENPEIFQNNAHLHKYLKNTLLMDGFGFTQADAEKIQCWLTDNVL